MAHLLHRVRWLLLLFALGVGPARADNYSDIWWNPGESGWGITIADHQTQLFAVWYTYQSDGSPTWFVIPGGTLSADRRFFTGDIYRTSGPAYSTAPFDPTSVAVTKIGTASFDFAPPGTQPGSASFTWTIGTATKTKQIQRQSFGNAAPDWTYDYTDIWWNPAESGWGLTLAQHGNNVFGVWYTYNAARQPLFVVLPSVTFAGPDSFSGTLYTTTGPAYTSATFDPTQVKVTPAGSATLHMSSNSGTFSWTLGSASNTENIVRQPFGNSTPGLIGKYLLDGRGVWALFDRRGWPNGYYSGDLLHMLGQFDSDLAASVGAANVAATVAAEVDSQLGKMQAMGINRVSLEMRTTDSTYIDDGYMPPTCNLPPALGLLWPQPAPGDLTSLSALLDLVQKHGMKATLILDNVHMEEQPPTNSMTWLGAIFRQVKDHPALDAIILGGDKRILQSADGTQSCGIPAEAPLWLGPNSYAGEYIRWAIGYGISLGVPANKLSAEAVVGNYFVDQQPGAGPEADGGHLWKTIVTMKDIFDALGIDPSQRLYALSFYEHRKCLNINGINLPCSDENADAWANDTLADVRNVIGSSRAVAVEFGNYTPVAADLPAPLVFESITNAMARHEVEAGGYWTWSESDGANEADAGHAGEPVRKRGLNDVYNPVQKELVAAYGFRLASIANASFEDGAAAPSNWTASGSGTVSRYRLADEAGQPVLAYRGSYDLRIVSGSGTNDTTSVTSDAIAVSPSTTYTTTANMRFQWSGDPLVGVPSASRPRVFMSIRYFRADGTPSQVREEDDFSFYQEDAPVSFGTFPQTYTTPSDARWLKIQFGVARNGLTQPITLDVDNLR